MVLLFFIIGKVNSQNFPILKYQAYFNYKILYFTILTDSNLHQQNLLKKLENNSTTFNISNFKDEIERTDPVLYKLCKELIRLNKISLNSNDSAAIVDFISHNVFKKDTYPELKKISDNNARTIVSDFNEYLSKDLFYARLNTSFNELKHKEAFDKKLLLITICILIFSIISFIGLYRLLNKKIVDAIKMFHYEIRNFVSRKEIDKLINDLSGIEKSRIETVKSNNKKGGSYSLTNQIRVPGLNNETNLSEHIIKETLPEFEIINYYFSTPNDDGSFLDRNKTTSFEQYSKFFLFRIDKLNSRKAYVSIVDDRETQIHILNNYKEYLDAVCNYKNPFSKASTKIITEKPGIAICEGDKWIIKGNEKIDIRFK